MTEEEAAVLDSLFQALDGLYDQDLSVAELQTMVAAAQARVSESSIAQTLGEAGAAMAEIMGSTDDEEQRNRAVLIATQPLREAVGDVLNRHFRS